MRVYPAYRQPTRNLVTVANTWARRDRRPAREIADASGRHGPRAAAAVETSLRRPALSAMSRTHGQRGSGVFLSAQFLNSVRLCLKSDGGCDESTFADRSNGVVLTCSIVVLFLSLPGRANANAVIEWNATALRSAFAGGLDNLTFGCNDALHESRMMAMMHVAIHDALNAIDRRYEPYAFDGHASGLKRAFGN